ncbi:MAG TPA: polymer-forming cytoskeletal protein [Nitrospiria bacterium]|nr:polymer-forming cytoskeletal protein [Nitrospiria bacterium]
MLRRDDKERKEGVGDEVIAFLGKGTEFKGMITYNGTIRIDGHVEGEIVTEGTLVVGEGAVIHAEISAGTVINGGKITGNVTALEKVQLLPTAVVDGSIKTPVLIIEEGVRFNGNCQMSGTAAIARRATEGSERVRGEEAEAVQEAR